MLTDLQKKKLIHFFGVFDTDQDGYIKDSDMKDVVRNLADHRDAGPGHPDHDDLHDLWMFTWDRLDKISHEHHGEVVGQEEWLALADHLLSSAEGYDTVMNAIGMRTFDVLDIDGDGHLTRDEWRVFYNAHTIDANAADHVFERFDADGDGFLSRDETMDKLREFFCSNDPDAAGNWFFGPLPT